MHSNQGCIVALDYVNACDYVVAWKYIVTKVVLQPEVML